VRRDATQGDVRKAAKALQRGSQAHRKRQDHVVAVKVKRATDVLCDVRVKVRYDQHLVAWSLLNR